MNRIRPWIIAALAAALTLSIMGVASAQPTPPPIFAGTVTSDDGSPVAAGLAVEAHVGETNCTAQGTTSARDGATRYTVILDYEQSACTERGSTVRFRVGDRWASETARIGQASPTVNLTLGPPTVDIDPGTVDIDIRVWRLQRDGRLFISARPPGATWNDFGTIGLPMDDGPFTHSSGALLDIEDITLNVSLQGGGTTAIDVRVWRLQRDGRLFISARPPGATWNDFGTIGLPMDDGPFTHSSGALLDIEDITLNVTLSGESE